jgi:hypothetical protein
LINTGQSPFPKSQLVSHQLNLTLLLAHTKYRYGAEPWFVAGPKTEKRFAMELESINTTFPTISDHGTILAMAAWFSVLCIVDYLIEKMDPKLARQALQDVKTMTVTDSGMSLGDDYSKSCREVNVTHAD